MTELASLSPTETTQITTYPQRCLVVDDEISIAGYVKKALSLAGFNVDMTLDPLDALEKMQGTFYDTIITDLNMPELGGLEFLKRARAISPNFSAIIISGYTSQLDRTTLADLNIKAVFEKPFKIPVLIETLCNINSSN
ncbi:MAG: response regulator [Verrucomicrobiota bacterium]